VEKKQCLIPCGNVVEITLEIPLKVLSLFVKQKHFIATVSKMDAVTIGSRT
jgi:hypothetical protein